MWHTKHRHCTRTRSFSSSPPKKRAQTSIEAGALCKNVDDAGQRMRSLLLFPRCRGPRQLHLLYGRHRITQTGHRKKRAPTLGIKNNPTRLELFQSSHHILGSTQAVAIKVRPARQGGHRDGSKKRPRLSACRKQSSAQNTSSICRERRGRAAPRRPTQHVFVLVCLRTRINKRRQREQS